MDPAAEMHGVWNKGDGGNGYFRGSRVWDSLYFGNIPATCATSFSGPPLATS
jgi:hypothetical protein